MFAMRLADSQETWPLSASGDQIWSSRARGTGRIEQINTQLGSKPQHGDFVIAKTSGTEKSWLRRDSNAQLGLLVQFFLETRGLCEGIFTMPIPWLSRFPPRQSLRPNPSSSAPCSSQSTASDTVSSISRALEQIARMGFATSGRRSGLTGATIAY